MKPSRRDLLAVAAMAAIEKKRTLGIVIHSYGIRARASKNRFAEPLTFLHHCRSLGVNGAQVALGAMSKDDAVKLRQRLDETEMYLEGIVKLPAGKGDIDRFSTELRAAKRAGATIVRTVCLNTRRYETFTTAEAFRDFTKKARESLALAEPIAARAGVQLAVENHKDWRIDEFLALLKWLSSKHVGVCVDTGNSVSLLEEPNAVVEAYAPYALTTHFKDMAVAEYDDGFLLAEVPFGSGFVDLAKLVKLLRAKRPEIRFNIEMITRDPLRVPCLSPKFWATLDAVSGRDLAEALSRVRRQRRETPLPRITGLSEAAQIRVEAENVERSLVYARTQLGL